jgi:uncharacterized protein YecE (DUF72 family)
VTEKTEPQLGLFGVLPDEETRGVVDPEVERVAKALPPHVRFGTSSWTYPGWKGIVYEGASHVSALTKQGLAAYAKHPLLRAVGIDRSFYAPIEEADLAAYAAQLPRGFPTLSKVWDEITTFVFPAHPRYGDRAGKKNLRFLDPNVFLDEVLPAYSRAFAAHTGPFLFELPRVQNLAVSEHEEILGAIDRLLDALPTVFTYAFELRTPPLLCKRYLEILHAHDAAHVLNYWTGMPDLATQMTMTGVLTAPFVIVRAMIPPSVRYEDAKAAFAPFDRIVIPQPGMRRDVAELSVRCADEGRVLTVLVGNKAEGCAPLTVRGIAEGIVGGMKGAG